MTIVNRTELAEILGRALSTIDTMVKKGCPFIERPDRKAGTSSWRFDTAAVVEWMLSEEATAEKSDPYKDASLLEKQSVAGLRALELAREQKVLVRADEYLMWVDEVLSIIKTGFLALPGRVVQKVSVETDPAKNLPYLAGEVNAVFDSVSSNLERIAALAPPPDVDPDAQPDDDDSQ